MLRIILKIKMILLNFNEVFYINGSDTLPPPLGKAEEQSVMKRISDGDDSARELLIVHNLRLVVYIAKKFESPSAGTEDLISIGTIGLIKAVNTFSPEKNIKLATYASRCIENEILMFLRKASQLKNEISIDEPLNTDYDGNELADTDGGSVGEDIKAMTETAGVIAASSCGDLCLWNDGGELIGRLTSDDTAKLFGTESPLTIRRLIPGDNGSMLAVCTDDAGKSSECRVFRVSGL